MSELRDRVTIGELFSENKGLSLNVLKFQREYIWENQQCQELLDDIICADIGYFLHETIFLIQNNSKVWGIVDGQQRLVTITLYLSIIYSILYNYIDVMDDEQHSVFTSLRNELAFRTKVGRKNNKNEYSYRNRLTLQEENNNDVDYAYILSKCNIIDKIDIAPLYYKKRRLYSRYKTMERYIRDYLVERNAITDVEIIEELIDLIKKFNSVTIIVQKAYSEDEAYELYDRTNSRGVKLDALELLKSHFMSNANSISKYESDICYSKWQEIIGYLTNKSDLKFNIKEQFFRHFYMSFKNDLEEEILENNPDWKGHLKKEINSSNLMSAYTILCDNLGYNILMNKLSKAAYYYSVVMYPYEKPDIIDSFKNKKYYGLLCLLKSLKVKQSYLLIPYILMEQERLELTDEDIAEIIRLVIVFFVWRNVLDSPAPRFFKSAILNFNIFVKNCFRGKELVDMLRKNFIEQFTLAHITTQMFIGGLHKPLYNGPTNTVSAILRTIEYYYSTRETDKHIWDNDWSIEHVFPQERPVSPVWVKEIANGDIAKANHLAMTKCHCLGNLTLTKYNSNLSTKSFIEKRDRKDNANGNGNYIGYRNGLYLNQYLVKQDHWTEAQIDERTELIIKEILKIFSWNKN